MRMQVRLAGVVALIAALGLLAGGGVAGAQRAMSSPTVKTRNIKGFGVVLVNAKGRTLYVFLKDKQSRVTCTGACAGYWPPLKWKGSGRPTAGGSAKRRFLGSDKDPAGGRVVTYKKWPLYTYAGDSAAGQATGEGSNNFGGKWYVISPSGKLIKHKQ
jgi:predicted lipoprotein with Yx(FWY)xxD motif